MGVRKNAGYPFIAYHGVFHIVMPMASSWVMRIDSVALPKISIKALG